MSRHPMRLPIYISGFLRYPRSAPRTVLASPRRQLSFLSASSREHRHRFPTPPTSRHQQREYPSSAKPQFSTMASATQFYDFKPLNSESLCHPRRLSDPQPRGTFHPQPEPCVPSGELNLTHPRNGRGGPPLRLQGPRHPRRQHGVQVRLHPSVPGPREALQGHLRQAP